MSVSGGLQATRFFPAGVVYRKAIIVCDIRLATTPWRVLHTQLLDDEQVWDIFGKYKQKLRIIPKITMTSNSRKMASEHVEGASVDKEEIARFAAMAADWWEPNGKFRPLHRFNPVRLKFIVSTLTEHFSRDPNASRPLQGLKLLDIGCGGGLLTEPLARLGAEIVGVDAGASNIHAAQAHARLSGLKIDYRHSSAESLQQENEQFDGILAMEIVEHVTNPPEFISTLSALLKPGGIMYVGTLNRSVKAYALAIIGAEYLLRWLPRGTHDWRRFLRPDELTTYLTNTGLTVKAVRGATYHPLSDKWLLTDDLSVNYMACAARPE